jgi:phosphoserine phosphatase
METKKRLLIIDFCGTLTDIQTADLFIYYLLKKYFFRRILFKGIKLFQYGIYLINKLNLFHIETSKLWFVFLLNGINPEVIKKASIDYSKHLLSKHMRKDVLIFINNNYRDYYKIILSAGYFDYINLVNTQLHFDEVYASKLLTSSNFPHKISYKIDRSYFGKDKLNFFLDYENRLGPFKEVVFFTDSITDIPLANYCKTVFCYPSKKIKNLIKKNKDWSELNSINIQHIS